VSSGPSACLFQAWNGRSPVEANSVVVTILAGSVHSSVNNPGANGRVSYGSLTHPRLCWREGEKVGHELSRPMVSNYAPYSPDLAPSDCGLFCYIMVGLAWCNG